MLLADAAFVPSRIRRCRPVAWIVCAMCLSACSRDDTRLQQHKESFESLGATTAAVMRAWLDGDVSGTYAGTALEQTFMLVEQERTALAQSPHMLLDPRGASLSQAAEKLSRLIAQMTGDVRAADGAAARMHLANLPIAPPDQP